MTCIAAILFAVAALLALLAAIKSETMKGDGMHIRINKHEVIYWNLLPKELRYWGYKQDWYDGPVPCFGFWLFHFYIWWKEK